MSDSVQQQQNQQREQDQQGKVGPVEFKETADQAMQKNLRAIESLCRHVHRHVTAADYAEFVRLFTIVQNRTAAAMETAYTNAMHNLVCQKDFMSKVEHMHKLSMAGGSGVVNT